MPTRFRGIWPAMVTPVAPDGRPDFAACEQLVDVFARQSLDGIYLLGSTGGWPLFHIEERMALAECVVRAAASRLPVMVHVGATTTADAVALAKHAARIGAAAISAVKPIYYECSTDTLFEHYRRIASATELPFFAYHLSAVSQAKFNPRDYVSRLLSLPNIAGMKLTDHDLFPFGLVRGFAGDRLNLLSGADEVMCQAVLAGADGAIGTFYNVWGESCRAARQAVASGDALVGREFMLRFQRAIFEVQERGTWTFLRAAILRKYHIDVGLPRPPLGVSDQPWPDAEVDRIIALVDQKST
jgi:N-acetylneuraminate lyase